MTRTLPYSIEAASELVDLKGYTVDACFRLYDPETLSLEPVTVHGVITHVRRTDYGGGVIWWDYALRTDDGEYEHLTGNETFAVEVLAAPPAPKVKPPTAAQLRVLRNLAEGRDPWWHLSGLSDHGGAPGTERVLRRNGWVEGAHRDVMQITDAGREAYNAALGR